MKPPSQSSLLLFFALSGGVMVVLLPLCGQRPGPSAPLEISRHETPPAVDLSDLQNIEREPLSIPDVDLAEGSDWIIPAADGTLPPSPPPSTPPSPSASVQPPAPVAAGLSADGGEADEIAAYLQKVEHALMSGKYWSSPEMMAQSLLAEMSTGQTGGLATLRESNAAVLDRLKQISPPDSCAAHHRETMATLEASVNMLRTWESMLEKGDLAGFASMTADAEALRSRAARVDAMTAALKDSAGQ